MKICGFCLLIFVFCFCLFFSAFEVSAQFVYDGFSCKTDTSKPEEKQLLFNIHNQDFFVDNEYTGVKTAGYTLPGFRLTPTLSYGISNNLFIEAGLSALRFHGAERYPCMVYANFPDWKGYQYSSGLHLMPYFRAVWFITPNSSLTFGNIENRNSHFLPEPLYNVENTFASDPEAGLQLRINTKYNRSDIWLNWQSFVFANDIHQEAFTLGISSRSRILFDNDKSELALPLSFLVQHLGGENLSEDFTVESWINLSLGLKLTRHIGKHFHITSGCDFLYYKSLSETTLMPFNEGWAYYPYIEASYKKLNIKFAFYDSEDFVSLLGSPHFNNFSTNTKGLVFERANQYYLRAMYRQKIAKACSSDFYAQIFRQNRITGDRPGFEKVVRNGFLSFSVGVILNIDHSISLKRFSKKANHRFTQAD